MIGSRLSLFAATILCHGERFMERGGMSCALRRGSWMALTRTTYEVFWIALSRECRAVSAGERDQARIVVPAGRIVGKGERGRGRRVVA